MDTEKRLVLAIVLCVAIFMIFTLNPSRRATPPKAPPQGTTTESTTSDVVDPSGTGTATPTGTGPDPAAQPEVALFPHDEDLHLASDKVRLELTTEGASVQRVILPDYHESDLTSPLTLVGPELRSDRALLVSSGTTPLDRVDWEVVAQSDDRIEFRYPLGQGEVRKRYSFHPDEPYLLHVDVEVRDTSLDYEILGPERVRFDAGSRQSNQAVTGLGTGEFEGVERVGVGLVPTVRAEDARTDVLWAGLESNYFAFIVRPLGVDGAKRVVSGSNDEGLKSEAGPNNKKGIQSYPYRVGFHVPNPGKTDSFEVFIGPKDPTLLHVYEERGYPELVYYGRYIGFIVRIFLALLRFFHGFTGSWGVAIIGLTFIVKLLLHPINKRNQGMMQRQSIRMKELQPKMDKIKEQHRNDPTRATREIQQLMRDENVNPLALFGGCLLIFLQLPIWIGLISTFTLAIELRQQPFLYIADLTQADHLFPLGLTLPFIGSHFNLLPILYVALTLINQRMMPRSSDPQMQQQQKMMTIMMVAFGFIFYSFSSGLLVYFITSAALGIIEQRIIRAELRREGIVTN
ncbi:MAG: membrane protein insertase YidC [Planctomycetes bacterium]|nr:membrane protein insertase YidC [Planctomycetota bacterium]